MSKEQAPRTGKSIEVLEGHRSCQAGGRAGAVRRPSPLRRSLGVSITPPDSPQAKLVNGDQQIDQTRSGG